MSEKCCVQKNLDHTKLWGQKIFLAKQYFGKKNSVPKNFDQISMVKIGSETAEIFLYGQMSPGQMLPG